MRSFLQIFEVKKMRTMSYLEPDKIVLEIGCGQGVGTKLIQKYFLPKKIYAVDLDQKMIERAKKKNTSSNIIFSVSDITSLSFEDNFFDAVFDFGVLHHIPNWKQSLQELKRVLKADGEIILEDLSKESFTNTFLGRVMKKLLDHPYKEMFSRIEFFRELRRLNFCTLKKYENPFWFVAILRKQSKFKN